MAFGTEVSARIQTRVNATAELLFSVAVAQGTPLLSEQLVATVEGEPLPLDEVVGPVGTRWHVAREVPVGLVQFDYHALVEGSAPVAPVTLLEDIQYRRQSRYCESDRLATMAGKHFRGLHGQALVNAVVEWTHQNLFYVRGSSRSWDGALDTYLAQQGVCRDFAHLVIAMLRGCNVPARMVSVYAPQLNPMDFHAVAEVAVDGHWQVVDATGLAPRGSLVRIATGRDAADTAFLTTHSGRTRFGSLRVDAVRHGEAATDQLGDVVTLGPAA